MQQKVKNRTCARRAIVGPKRCVFMHVQQCEQKLDQGRRNELLIAGGIERQGWRDDQGHRFSLGRLGDAVSVKQEQKKTIDLSTSAVAIANSKLK